MSHNMIEVSFIIPVYNVEKWISICLEQFSYMETPNIEVIVVDDGSTDKSGKLCDEWAKKSPCITVIHKNNGGVSSARNIGIKSARGKYIMFVDGDDYIEKESINLILENFC